MNMIALAHSLPDPEEFTRVLIFTDGYDFAGQQFFDVRADQLNPTSFEDPSDQPEDCRLASHWRPLPFPERPSASMQQSQAARQLAVREAITEAKGE